MYGGIAQFKHNPSGALLRDLVILIVNKPQLRILHYLGQDWVIEMFCAIVVVSLWQGTLNACFSEHSFNIFTKQFPTPIPSKSSPLDVGAVLQTKAREP